MQAVVLALLLVFAPLRPESFALKRHAHAVNAVDSLPNFSQIATKSALNDRRDPPGALEINKLLSDPV